jgi:hypothetical protein
MKIPSIAMCLAALAGCTSTVTHEPPPTYTPPTPRPPLDLTVVSSRGFDHTWDALVNYASATRFSIDEFEKDSGLLTLSDSPADPQSVVDCGTWTQSGRTQPYVARTDGLSLRTRANVFVQRSGGGQTRLRINVRYEMRDTSGNMYAFTTNQPVTVAVKNRTVGTPTQRICLSNHVAEREFLEGVRNAVQ